MPLHAIREGAADASFGLCFVGHWLKLRCRVSDLQPSELPDGKTKCFVTGKPAMSWGLFGRSY